MFQGRHQCPCLWGRCFLCGSSLIHSVALSEPLFSSQNLIQLVGELQMRWASGSGQGKTAGWREGGQAGETLGERQQENPPGSEVAPLPGKARSRFKEAAAFLPRGGLDLRSSLVRLPANSFPVKRQLSNGHWVSYIGKSLLFHLIPTIVPGVQDHCPCFTNEEIEAQRANTTWHLRQRQ